MARELPAPPGTKGGKWPIPNNESWRAKGQGTETWSPERGTGRLIFEKQKSQKKDKLTRETIGNGVVGWTQSQGRKGQ